MSNFSPFLYKYVVSQKIFYNLRDVMQGSDNIMSCPEFYDWVFAVELIATYAPYRV
jgi:hypothetical protein